MYHTQERRYKRLIAPIPCNKHNAWLGTGYYFWNDEEDAIYWGKKSKKKTGYFEVYKADINTEKFLDTVFDETGYNFYKSQIEKVGKYILSETGRKATVKQICSYINERANWTSKLDGILLDDSPIGENSLIPGYPYRKRIQAVVYNLECISNFEFAFDLKCE